MLPILATAAEQGAGWIMKNVIGGSGWLQSIIDPTVATSPTMTNDGSLAAYAAGRYKFLCQPLAPTNDDIKALDDFFEGYGYRVDRFQTPNLAVRGTFTYVKTRDAVVECTNRNAALQMAAMLNSGYKFWKGDIG